MFCASVRVPEQTFPLPSLGIIQERGQKVKKKLTRGFKKIWDNLGQFNDPAALFERFATIDGDISRPAPENSLA